MAGNELLITPGDPELSEFMFYDVLPEAIARTEAQHGLSISLIESLPRYTTKGVNLVGALTLHFSEVLAELDLPHRRELHRPPNGRGDIFVVAHHAATDPPSDIDVVSVFGLTTDSPMASGVRSQIRDDLEADLGPGGGNIVTCETIGKLDTKSPGKTSDPDIQQLPSHSGLIKLGKPPKFIPPRFADSRRGRDVCGGNHGELVQAMAPTRIS